MQNLTNVDYKLYKSIIRMSQEDLRRLLHSYLNKKYKTVFSSTNYLYAVGEIPIALCAHMDTVWDKPPKDIYYDREQGVMWSPQGGCGDDRAGIFAILKIIQSGLRPSIIFTADEEVGGLGAEALVKDYPESPSQLNYIIQLDRRGTNDCVFYDCENEDFTKYIESFGFVEAFGSFSDISELCPSWGMAGVNLSIGYENEHSVSEIVRISALLQTIEKVKSMLRVENIPEFEFIPGPYLKYYGKSHKSLYSWPGWDDDEDDYYSYFDKDEAYCDGCHNVFKTYEMIPVGKKNYCPDCTVDRVNWCFKCGEAFETNSENPHELCPECRKKVSGGKNTCKSSMKKSKRNLTV